MPTANGEMTPSDLIAQFRSLSLRELSIEAEEIAQILETEDEDEDSLFRELQEYLAIATQSKIDGYCWYQEMLKAEIEEWKTKKRTLSQMCDEVIRLKEAKLNALKQNLIRLAEQGVIENYLLGHNKAIEIRPNTKPSVELLCPVDDPSFPMHFREIKWVADKQAIAQAYEAGQDVSAVAKVTWGKQVRFKTAPRRKPKKTEEKANDSPN